MNELVISASMEIAVMLEAVASDIGEHFYSLPGAGPSMRRAIQNRDGPRRVVGRGRGLAASREELPDGTGAQAPGLIKTPGK